MDVLLAFFRWTCGKRNHPAVAFQRRPVHDGLFRYTKIYRHYLECMKDTEETLENELQLTALTYRFYQSF